MGGAHDGVTDWRVDAVLDPSSPAGKFFAAEDLYWRAVDVGRATYAVGV
jgi:hypothetical protein